jgi:hypothetical protein
MLLAGVVVLAGCGGDSSNSSSSAPSNNSSSAEGEETGSGGPGTDQAQDLFACLQMSVAGVEYGDALGEEGLSSPLRQMLTSDEQAAFITIPPADLDDDDGGNDTAEAAQITLYTFSAPENASSFREAISEDSFLRTIRRDLDETGVDPATGEEFTFTTSPDAQVSDRVVVLGYDAFTDAQLALLEGCGLTGLISED